MVSGIKLANGRGTVPKKLKFKIRTIRILELKGSDEMENALECIGNRADHN